jgi:cellulose synthase/poly-beta-1,6-N-acetylglucosamine synthase-like glycosyltransferase
MNMLLLALYWLAIGALAMYGLNCYVLSIQFVRHRSRHLGRLAAVRERWAATSPEWPVVTVQLPIFNERLVVERLIDAVCALRYPRDLLEIQVLDDSTDETRARIATLVRKYRARGVDIVHTHRTQRTGYKAGALAKGLEVARGEWIAIFDADFVPAPDFLERTVPFFSDPDVGVVQCRWEHLDRDYNSLTRLQGLAIDGHFGVEQAARCWSGWFLNFNGTAGVWRRKAIDQAGGWEGDTLTEDLDLSYRAQLQGWRIEYLFDTGVPAEIPADLSSFKSQQRRWAKGSIQTACKLLGRVMRADLPRTVKFQAFLHLTHYAIHPLMLIVALLSVPVHLVGTPALGYGGLLVAMLFVGTCGPTTLYVTSQKALGRRSLRTLRSLPALMLIGTGIALSNSRAVLEALSGRQSEFVRTPKAHVVGHERASGVAYRLPQDRLQVAEYALATWTAMGCLLHIYDGYQLFAPFLLLYAAGFATVAFFSGRRAVGDRTVPLHTPEKRSTPIPTLVDVARAELPNETGAPVT